MIILGIDPGLTGALAAIHWTKDQEKEVTIWDAPVEEIKVGKSPIMGFSAVGDNSRFKKDLLKFNLKHFRGFPDHFKFSLKDLLDLNFTRKQKRAEYLVCTEKDFIRIFSILNQDIPLIYAQNFIKYNLNLIDIILAHAKNAGFI